MKTRTLKYMMTAVLLFGTTVAVAGSQPRKVKVKSVVKASAGMKKASSQQRTISSASALVGTYTAVGGNQRNVASWPVTITTDNSTSNKVWLANLSPHFYETDYQAPTYNYFYGTLNSSKTELHIPVGQRMTGTYSFTGNGTQYNNQIVYIGAYDEYNCSEGYINVHEDDIVIRIENNGSRLVLTDSVFFYSVGSDNTFWMLDEVYNNTVLTKEAGQDDGVITLTTAGTLDTKVSGTETSLVIRGPLNSADLKVLRDMCVNKNLTSLDISGANIVGGNTTKYYNDYSATDNDVLPKYLFYNSKLETLVLPSSIKELDNYCFAYSSGLTTITIPASVTNLTSYCFYGCSALTAIYVENGNTNYTHYSGVLYTKDGKTLVKYPEGKSGTSYTVNSGVNSISDQAFANAKLTSVTLPTTLKELGYSVFSYSALTTLSIPASVTTVTTSTFSAMSSLTSFSVASGNTVLSNDSRGVLFDKNKTVLKAYPQGNTSTTYTIPSTVTEIEYDAFWTNNYLKKITLPDNVTTIGGYAFGTCHSLKEINIPAKVTKFGNYAFNSSTLESVTSAITSPTAIDETVFNSITTSAILYVPAGTKSKYQSLTGWNKFTNIVEQGGGGGGTTGNVTYSNGVMTVTMTTAGTLESSIANSGYSTANVTELVVTGPLNGADLKVIRDLTTTGNVTKLRLTKDGKNATIVGGDPTEYYGSYTASKDNVLPAYLFYSSKLTNIYLPNTITSIESYCFGNSKQLVDLSIPASVTSVSSSFVNNCSALTTLYVGSGSSSYDALNGVLYTKDLKTLVRYPEGLSATSFSVRSGVTAIASYAFYKAKLTSISLPTTLQSIGSSTFSNSSIKTLSIPASVTSVATTSFSSMSSLTSFSVASGSSTLSTDTRGALFDKNKTILKAYPLGNTSTTYTIPSTVVELEYDAFWGHDYLKAITLPNGVKTIGGWALSGCGSLEEVNIPATVTKIDGYAFSSNQNLKKITSDITTPFDVADDAFSGTCDVATLYVPAGTKSKYQSKNGWKLFKTIVEQGGGGQYKTYLYFVGSSSDWNTVKDKPLYCENNDGVYQGFMYLDGDFKFKEYDSWDENYGMGTAIGKIASDGSNFNISSSDAGFYAVQLNVPEQTYSFTRIYFIDVVGNCVAGNDWSDGTKLTTYNVSENCWEGDVIFNSGGESFKLRGNGTWNKEDGNWGGTLENVLNGSDNDLITPYTGKCHLKFYVSCNTKSYLVMSPVSDNPTAKGSGTLADPFNSIAANNKGQELAVGQSTSEKYYVKGKISYVKFPFSSDYGTATFYISDDGTRNNEFYVYATYYLENKSWVTGNPQIAVGDEVIIYGTVSNYNGTSETTDKKSYVYSHNGMTRISGGVAFNNGTMTLTMTTAGNLQTAIASSGYSAASVRELVITGPINGTDIRYIRQLAGINYSNSSVTATLETLNLENANIVSGGEYYKSPAYATSDNVVGLSMFADTQLKYIFLPKSATTIMSQAFGNCKQLMGVTVYNKVTSVPGNLFIDCSALCYIDWQPTRGLTSGMLPTSSVRNPNLLLYVTSSSYAPYTTPNVVVGSTATQVTLTNGYAFWAPREFTATNISYSRSFTKTTGNGSAQGWETITLPFQPTKISHATKGELVPFGRWSGTSDTKKPFWLYGFGSSGFTASNYLSANQPYIIAMPNNTMYDDAYRVNGTVTFSATSATVKASLQAVGTTNGVRTLRPAYQTVEATNNKYVLNANGSQFVTYRAASPFEAYFTTTEANARGFIDIFDELPTGIESIPTVGTDETPENVYDLQGRKVVTPQRGIYIRNGKKVIVR